MDGSGFKLVRDKSFPMGYRSQILVEELLRNDKSTFSIYVQVWKERYSLDDRLPTEEDDRLIIEAAKSFRILLPNGDHCGDYNQHSGDCDRCDVENMYLDVLNLIKRWKLVNPDNLEHNIDLLLKVLIHSEYLNLERERSIFANDNGVSFNKLDEQVSNLAYRHQLFLNASPEEQEKTKRRAKVIMDSL